MLYITMVFAVGHQGYSLPVEFSRGGLTNVENTRETNANAGGK